MASWKGRFRIAGADGVPAGFLRDAFHTGLQQEVLRSQDDADGADRLESGVGHDQPAEQCVGLPEVADHRLFAAGALADVVGDDEHGAPAPTLLFAAEAQGGIVHRRLDARSTASRSSVKGATTVLRELKIMTDTRSPG
jgi:hypothetical protein